MLLTLFAPLTLTANAASATADDVIFHAKSKDGQMATDFGYTTEWCAFFVCQMGQEAGANFPYLGGVNMVARWFPNNNAGTVYYFDDYSMDNLRQSPSGSLNTTGLGRCIKASRDTFQLQPGDLICYDQSFDGAGFDHIGFVERFSNGTIYTIEGNSGAGRCYKERHVIVGQKKTMYGTSDQRVQVFVRPDYTPSVSFAGMHGPTTLDEGQSFAVGGTVTAYSDISQIHYAIKQGTTTVCGGTVSSINAKTFTITGNSAIEEKLNFGKLLPGSYILKYAVEIANGGYKEWEKAFTVKSISFAGMKSPTTLNEGQSFALGGTINTPSNMTRIIAAIKKKGQEDGERVMGCSVTDINAKTFDIGNSSVIPKGLNFSALKVGTYYVKYVVETTNGGWKVWEKEFKVNAVAVTGVKLNKSTLAITVGASETLSATISPSNASNKAVTWSSNNTGVATVTNGKVKAVSAGKAVITVTTSDGSKTATCTVTVNDSPPQTVPVTGVTLSATFATLEVGQTKALTATVAPNNATDKTVTWSSNNTSVATVSNGTVTAQAAGTATITVTTSDDSKIATCTVTVTAPVVEDKAVVLSLSSATTKPGNTVRLHLTVDSATAAYNTLGVSQLTYDSSLLTFVGFVDNGELVSGATLPSLDDAKATITLGYLTASARTGKVCTLEFRAVDEIDDSVTATVSMTSLVRNDSTELTSVVRNATVTISNELLGDVNGDNIINLQDAIALMRYSMYPTVYPINYSGTVDFNKDGAVNLQDAIALMRYSMYPSLYPLDA